MARGDTREAQDSDVGKPRLVWAEVQFRGGLAGARVDERLADRGRRGDSCSDVTAGGRIALSLGDTLVESVLELGVHEVATRARPCVRRDPGED